MILKAKHTEKFKKKLSEIKDKDLVSNISNDEKKIIIRYTEQFKKDLILIKRNGYNLELIQNFINMIKTSQKLDIRYREHNINDKYKGFRECHITPDLILIYKIEKNLLTVLRIGVHNDLF